MKKNECNVCGSPISCRACNSNSGVDAALTTDTEGQTTDKAGLNNPDTAGDSGSRRSGRRGSNGSSCDSSGGSKDFAASTSSPSSPRYSVRGGP